MQEIIIKIKGDSSDIVKLGEELKKLGKVDEDNAKQFKKNNEDQKKATKEQSSALKDLFKDMTDIKGQLMDIGKNILAAFAVQSVIEFGKESVKAFMEAELNAKKLNTAITTIGGEGQQAFQKLIDQSAELQEKGIFSDDAIQQSQTQLAQLGLTSKEIEKLIPLIADMAAATGMDLGQATDVAIQGINGQTRALKPLGLEFTNTGDKAENYSILVDKLGKYQGQMNSVMETSTGKLTNLGNKWDDVKESIGGALLSLIGFGEKSQSENYQEEQSALNQLVTQITNVNTKTEDRQKLIDQLNSKYPNFLKNLNAERVTNEQILGRLVQVNKQYIAKIALAKFDEDNADVNERAASAQIDLSEKTQKLTSTLYEYKTANEVIAVARKNWIDQTDVAAVTEAVLAENTNLSIRARIRLKGDLQDLQMAQWRANQFGKEANYLVTQRKKLEEDLIKQLGIKLEVEKEIAPVTSHLGKTDEEAATKTEKKTKAITAQLGEMEKLRKAVADANKEIENQAAVGDVSQKALDKYTAAAKKLEEAEQRIIDARKKRRGAEDMTPIPSKDALPEWDKFYKEFNQKNNDSTNLFVQNVNKRNETAEEEVLTQENKYELLNSLASVFNNASQVAYQIDVDNLRKANTEKVNEIERYYNEEIAKAGTNTELVKALEQEKANKLLEIKAQADAEEKRIKKEQFERDRTISVFQTIIATAEAITKALTAGPIAGPPLAISAGVIGATQLGVILSQPAPYAKGTDFLKRGNNPVGVDTIPVMANEGEAIIPTERNLEHPGLAKAWIKGTLDDYININYVIPALKRTNKKESFADNIAKAIQMNAGFNDLNLLESDKMSRKLLMEQNKLLKKIANGSGKNSYRF